MTRETKNPVCPHCKVALKTFKMPLESGWEEGCQWACFNDECSYYKTGWEWMWQQYRVKASYRYRLTNLQSKYPKPLAVWSESALRELIIE